MLLTHKASATSSALREEVYACITFGIAGNDTGIAAMQKVIIACKVQIKAEASGTAKVHKTDLYQL